MGEFDNFLLFEQCGCYNNPSSGPTDRHACKDGYPSSRIRMCMEFANLRTRSRALCCAAKSKSAISRSDKMHQRYRGINNDFLAITITLPCPTCYTKVS